MGVLFKNPTKESLSKSSNFHSILGSDLGTKIPLLRATRTI